MIFKAIFLNEHELQGYIMTALYESGTGVPLSSSSRQYFVLIHITIHYAFYTEYCETLFTLNAVLLCMFTEMGVVLRNRLCVMGLMTVETRQMKRAAQPIRDTTSSEVH